MTWAEYLLETYGAVGGDSAPRTLHHLGDDLAFGRGAARLHKNSQACRIVANHLDVRRLLEDSLNLSLVHGISTFVLTGQSQSIHTLLAEIPLGMRCIMPRSRVARSRGIISVS